MAAGSKGHAHGDIDDIDVMQLIKEQSAFQHVSSVADKGCVYALPLIRCEDAFQTIETAVMPKPPTKTTRARLLDEIMGSMADPDALDACMLELVGDWADVLDDNVTNLAFEGGFLDEPVDEAILDEDVAEDGSDLSQLKGSTHVFFFSDIERSAW